MSIIPKGLTHDFRRKFEKDLYMMFNYILNGKKGFLEY